MLGSDPREMVYITASQLAAQYGVQPVVVYKWVEQGCPCKMEKKGLMFQLKAVIAWQKRSGV